MKLLELLPPAQIADTALRVAPARGGPTLDMLAARGNAQELGGSGRHAGERGAHAAAINQLGRLGAAVDLDAIGIARIGGIDLGDHSGKSLRPGGH